MKEYSFLLCFGVILFIVFDAVMCSSAICSSVDLPGNCSSSENCSGFFNPKESVNCTKYINNADPNNSTRHRCNYVNYKSVTELGVRVPGPNDHTYYRIPDKNMDSSSNKQDAKRARIGFKDIGQNKAVWCAAANDSELWLEVNFDNPAVIEKIEVRGNPQDTNKWVENFYLMYTNSTGHLIPYINNHSFSSNEKGSCHYVYMNTSKVRIYSKSDYSRTCIQLAIYGKLPDALPMKVVIIPVTSSSNIIDGASVANDEFLKAYLLWAIFLAVLIFLVIFTLTLLFCWCCRRQKVLKSALEITKESNPDYVPAWRRIDEKAAKGYIATQETQEVKIAFTDEYIPPDLQKEKKDPNDDQYYRNKIFSFSGCQTVNPTTQRIPPVNQENGAAIK